MNRSPSGFSVDQPYNDLPLLPPREDFETKSILKKVISARTAVEGLKHAGRTIPNQAVLLRAIVLQEARASSEIENVLTTQDELYRAMSKDDETSDPQTKEVLRYAHAIWQGYDLVQKGRPLNTPVFCELASTIKQTEIGIRHGAGTRIGNPRTGKTVYTPPMGKDRISNLLNNLAEFQYAREDFDPILKIAIGHYQFEAIHPFSDGNGRTGRVLNILWMLEKGLLELPVLYLSRAIIESRSEYYNGLRAVTEKGDWETWLSYFLEIIEATSIETRRRVEAIRHAIDAAKVKARSELPSIYSSELIDLIFSQPYTRIAFLDRAGIAKRQTASVYLNELERIGLLRSQKVWREVLFINDELMNALT